MERLTPLGVILKGIRSNPDDYPKEWDDRLIDPQEVKKLREFEREMYRLFGLEDEE